MPNLSRVRVVAWRGLVWVAMAAAGCGGSDSSPTRPSPVVPTPLPVAVVSPTVAPAIIHVDVTDGVTGARVSTGQFSVGNDPTLAFAGAFDAGPIGSALVVNAPGYLRRETTLPFDGHLTLWPASDASEQEYVRRLVYVAAVDNLTERTLSRLPYGSFSVSLAPEIDSAVTRAVLTRVFAQLRDLTHDAVNLGLGDANALVRVSVDPTVTPFAGYTNWSSAGGYISVGTIRLVSASRAQDEALLLHEFGHMIGLQHSSRTADVMNSAARVTLFTPAERGSVTMMFQRNARNVFPDADAGTSFRSLTPPTAQFGCGR